jgi:hypothetical protein
MKSFSNSWRLLASVALMSVATFLHMKTVGWASVGAYEGYFIAPFLFGFVLALIYWAVGRLIDSIRKRKVTRPLVTYSAKTILVIALLALASVVLKTSQYGFLEGGETEVILKSYFTEANALQTTYATELDKIGWGSILDINRLKNDRNLAESKKIVQQALEILNESERKAKALIDKQKANTRNLNIPPEVKQDMLRGIDRGMEDSQQSFQRESDSIILVQSIIGLLDSTKWVADGDQLRFANDEDVAKFNSMLERLRAIAAEQERQQQGRIRELCENRQYAHVAEELCREMN